MHKRVAITENLKCVRCPVLHHDFEFSGSNQAFHVFSNIANSIFQSSTTLWRLQFPRWLELCVEAWRANYASDANKTTVRFLPSFWREMVPVNFKISGVRHIKYPYQKRIIA